MLVAILMLVLTLVIIVLGSPSDNVDVLYYDVEWEVEENTNILAPANENIEELDEVSDKEEKIDTATLAAEIYDSFDV